MPIRSNPSPHQSSRCDSVYLAKLFMRNPPNSANKVVYNMVSVLTAFIQHLSVCSKPTRTNDKLSFSFWYHTTVGRKYRDARIRIVIRLGAKQNHCLVPPQCTPDFSVRIFLSEKNNNNLINPHALSFSFSMQSRMR